MKVGIGISLLSGIFLSYVWGFRRHEPVSSKSAVVVGQDATRLNAHQASSSPESIQRTTTEHFDIELINQAFSHYDGAEKEDLLTEARLRSFMFLVPKKHLEGVLKILLEVKNKKRFQQIACNLFSRWTELDPETALSRASEAGAFSLQAERGVMTTWLNTDAEAALQKMLAKKTPENLQFLSEFLRYKSLLNPQAAAAIVDKMCEGWPNADSQLFPLVAMEWAKSDSENAAKWVASYEEENVKRPLLRSIVREAAKQRKGFLSLDIANMISDPKLREVARNVALHQWATAHGGYSLTPDADPSFNLSGGFPDDWTDNDIKVFVGGFTMNHAKKFPDLLKITKNESQKILIYEGIMAGTSGGAESIPHKTAAFAVESLPNTFASSTNGKKSLERFIQQWNKVDSAGARDWLSKQPVGPKTDVMQSQINPKQVKP
jgi:hypothetical protein